MPDAQAEVVTGAGHGSSLEQTDPVNALTAYPRLPDDANAEAWLVTIAHRKARDITRAAARRGLAEAIRGLLDFALVRACLEGGGTEYDGAEHTDRAGPALRAFPAWPHGNLDQEALQVAEPSLLTARPRLRPKK